MIRKRDPRRDDKHIVRLIRSELIPLMPPKLNRPVSDRMLAQRLERGSTFVWSTRRQSGVSGFITIIPKDRDLFVDMLAVSPAFQGRGIGSALLHKAEIYGRERGFKSMTLYVNQSNASAIRFYQRHGLMVFRYDPQVLCYIMKKRIG